LLFNVSVFAEDSVGVEAADVADVMAEDLFAGALVVTQAIVMMGLQVQEKSNCERNHRGHDGTSSEYGSPESDSPSKNTSIC
jgi:hypothetical protein